MAKDYMVLYVTSVVLLIDVTSINNENEFNVRSHISKREIGAQKREIVLNTYFSKIYFVHLQKLIAFSQTIKVMTKLPNSEQSYKGKVKTHNYINRQNQSTTGKL
jgi:hypothetical protein